MEDVQIAIAILTRFLQKEAQVKQILARVQSLTRQGSSGYSMGGGMPSFENIVRMVFEEQERRKNPKAEETPEGVVPPEDVSKMKELTEKYKKKPQTSSTQ